MPTRTMITTPRVLVHRLSVSASIAAGSSRLATSSPGPVSTKIATIGSVRNDSATASATASSGGNQRAWLTRRPGGRTRCRFNAWAPAPSSSPSMKACAPSAVARALDDRDAVLDGRLERVGQLDRPQLAAGALDVGAVDEPGVDRALRQLADDAADVGLVASARWRGSPSTGRRAARQHLARVVADRDALGPDGDRHALPGQVVERRDLAAVGRDREDELVRGEAHRPLDEALLEELVGQLRVGGGEHVGLDALPDLRRELVRAGERQPHVAALELLAVGRERLLQRRGRRDDDHDRVALGRASSSSEPHARDATPCRGQQDREQDRAAGRDGHRAAPVSVRS